MQTYSLDECRELDFPGVLTFYGERLINHEIRTVNVLDQDFCELSCYLENNCVSINLELEASMSGTHKCDLNNSTHKEHGKDLVKTAGYVYLGTNVSKAIMHFPIPGEGIFQQYCNDDNQLFNIQLTVGHCFTQSFT